LASIGIAEGFCRMSVGLEEPHDIIDDLRNALDETA
ncbi:MAG: PLP-dependent transferase, partial [Actinomycetota bacterium]|nr:PLP-dependent transferase [Actinomycetota bacterium]